VRNELHASAVLQRRVLDWILADSHLLGSNSFFLCKQNEVADSQVTHNSVTDYKSEDNEWSVERRCIVFVPLSLVYRKRWGGCDYRGE
jgi:hypothetical protein